MLLAQFVAEQSGGFFQVVNQCRVLGRGVGGVVVHDEPVGLVHARLERQIVDDAAAALGGASRLSGIKTIVIEGEGTNGNLGQDMTMEASGQQFVLSGYKRAIDVGALRTRIDQTRTPNFAYFQGQQPQKQVFGVADDVAYNIAPDGRATRAANAVARDRRAEIYHHPVTIVRVALDPATQLSNPRTAGNERVVDVATSNGLKFTLAADANTHLPTRVVSMTDNTNLGDVAIETTFADFEDVVSDLALIGVDEPLAREAGALAEEFELRGYDAVHLATALALGEDVAALVTWDGDLAEAAIGASLPIGPA